jgi:3-(3-hydroxy-phenyl)propionate hydroxylase
MIVSDFLYFPGQRDRGPTMAFTDRVQVVVIGAGPTDASAAAMLAQRGIDCLVLERWPEVYPLPRAVHFDDVFRVFAGLRITDRESVPSTRCVTSPKLPTQRRPRRPASRKPNDRLRGHHEKR